eukprot:753270-Hanusia_phi.AAC.3
MTKQKRTRRHDVLLEPRHDSHCMKDSIVNKQAIHSTNLRQLGPGGLRLQAGLPRTREARATSSSRRGRRVEQPGAGRQRYGPAARGGGTQARAAPYDRTVGRGGTPMTDGYIQTERNLPLRLGASDLTARLGRPGPEAQCREEDQEEFVGVLNVLDVNQHVRVNQLGNTNSRIDHSDVRSFVLTELHVAIISVLTCGACTKH